MGKLRFKETEREVEERHFRRNQRAKRKERERGEQYADADIGIDSKRRKSSHTPEEAEMDEHNYEKYLREAEDRAFRTRLFDEMGMDERQDELHESYQSYYVPDRWASSSYTIPTDPRHMTDDEYAEWVRESMWKRTHAKEAEERERKRAERSERKAREDARRRETKRLEAELRKDSERRRRLRDRARQRAAVEAYTFRWSKLAEEQELTWARIPWPTHEPPIAPDGITIDVIRDFILDGSDDDPAHSKEHRQKLKDALLLWHPDRFEGRWLPRIRDLNERDRVREAVGVIARHLNQLMEDST